MSTFQVHITGNPNIPTLAKVNVREQPGTSGVAVRFEADIGTRNLPILDVKPDQANNALNGKVYQWFLAQFPSGATGWLRDDLVSIEGDGTDYGYPILTGASYAYGLMRQLLPDAAPVPPPAPAPVPTPPPVLPPTPAPSPLPTPTPPSEVKGLVISVSGLNLREAPISGKVITRLAYKEIVKILQTRPQGGTSNYIWAQVESAEGIGWVRSDYLSIIGDGSGFGLSKGDEYPSPMQNYWWIRGQNHNQNPNEAEHLGWDFSASVGESIRSGPNGGIVARLLTCTRCTDSQPNVLSQGIPLDNASVFLDPAWGFGYGNAVIVRYLNSLLPASTLERLQIHGLANAHLYVIYAHLSAITVQVGQQLDAFQQVGIIGNTGNSSATHVHVEVRASTDANTTDWAALRPHEFDPEILFRR